MHEVVRALALRRCGRRPVRAGRARSANLLFWLGPDKLCFGSDYAIWSPKWLIEKFMAFELPEDLKQEYHVDLTFDIKRKILGENTARLYGIDIPAQTAKLSQDGIGLAR